MDGRLNESTNPQYTNSVTITPTAKVTINRLSNWDFHLVSALMDSVNIRFIPIIYN